MAPFPQYDGTPTAAVFKSELSRVPQAGPEVYQERVTVSQVSEFGNFDIEDWSSREVRIDLKQYLAEPNRVGVDGQRCIAPPPTVLDPVYMLLCRAAHHTIQTSS